jgi:hypothetical protein
MSDPDWSFLADSASAARQDRATKNEKMSTRYTSCLTLQSGLQALREIGKHLAASEREQPRWLSRYAPVFLISFPSTLCTLVHSFALCAPCALKDTILPKENRSASFVFKCTYVHFVHFVHLRTQNCQKCTEVHVLLTCAPLCTMCTLCTFFSKIVCTSVHMTMSSDATCRGRRVFNIQLFPQ